ncbi:MAG: adenine-specific methyltransferase EcoRI family protein [Bacteroidales bacterium]|nr:adenine-specific methyltransferase EcoRI family protein [Bacteroidales bacterium]
MANENLSKAKNAKNDEFYTQYADIEKEMNAYLEYNPDVFRGKTILLPCDDPEWSNFTKYFAQNFENFGLKKLISTSFAVESKNYKTQWEPTLFETENPLYSADKTRVCGKIFILDHDTNRNGRIDIEDLEWHYLEGSGDFRSEEVKKLRDEADIIITNPPFSLFREFLAWIVEADKKFVIIGNMNAITYKEVFPLIKENKIWLGNGFNAGNAFFRMAGGCERDFANGVFDDATGLVKFRNCCWFTNLDHGRRHKPLKLMTMADNIKFSKHKEIKGRQYAHYDNYDAIEVPFTDAIPNDYEGVMGVPISFLDKYCPEQFEILGITQRNDDPYKLKQYTVDEYKNANDLNARGVIIIDGKPKSMYARVLIRKNQ